MGFYGLLRRDTSARPQKPRYNHQTFRRRTLCMTTRGVGVSMPNCNVGRQPLPHADALRRHATRLWGVLRGREPFATGGFLLRCRRSVAKGSRPLPALGAAIRFLLGKVGASTYPTGLPDATGASHLDAKRPSNRPCKGAL